MTTEFWSCEQYDAEAQKLYEAGDYDAALDLLKEGLSLYPGSPELLVSLGYARLARDEFAWARRAFEESLGTVPDHEEALAGMGEVLLKLGERGRAFLLFERVLELGFHTDVDLMLCIGRILYREGLTQKAERFFRLALRAEPECADAAIELAYTLHRLGEGRSALRWARRAVQLDTTHNEARAFFANLLYEDGHFAAALDQFERIPVSRMWDPVAIWRTSELLRRVRGHEANAAVVQSYMDRLERITADPTPEEMVLAEVEATFNGETLRAADHPGQLDMFGWIPAVRPDEDHQVRAADGRIYEGDWESIVMAMRDGSDDPTRSLDEFMRGEADRLRDQTGVVIAHDDPRSFIEESAKVGALRIER